MALLVKYILDNDVYEHAYVRIHKIRTVMIDYEKFINLESDDDIQMKLDWEVRNESIATAYVWADKLSRDNRANPIKYFQFKFEYDLKSSDNIFKQAYRALKETDEFKDSIDV